MTLPTIGFVGLGQMGRPIAANLVHAGASVLVCGRRPAVLEGLAELGASTTGRVADLAERELIFLCLPDGETVRETLLGADGIVAGIKPGSTVIDLSTIDYGTTLEVAAALAERGAGFLDAPISGMEKRAIDGTLTIMLGGPAELVAQMKPVLGHIGNNILHMGGTGAGQLTKLINQLLFDINAAAIAEILPVAVKLGLDPDAVGSVVNSGTGRSHASEFFIPRILKGNFSDGYPMAHAYKDLVAGAELGARQGLPMPVLAAATATYQTALLQGHGELDKGGMIRVFETLLGVAFRSQNNSGDAQQ